MFENICMQNSNNTKKSRANALAIDERILDKAYLPPPYSYPHLQNTEFPGCGQAPTTWPGAVVLIMCPWRYMYKDKIKCRKHSESATIKRSSSYMQIYLFEMLAEVSNNFCRSV